MRIVIDLQACQTTSSRNRGIGRYSMSLAKAMVRHSGTHEFWLLLNARFPETIEGLKAAFDGLISQERIKVFESPVPNAEIDPANAWRIRASEKIREALVADLHPDIVHISSLFEGLGDEAVTSVSTFEVAGSTAVTLYDLIPFIHKDVYLTNTGMRSWYYRKLQSLKSADILLAISNSSRAEVIDVLQLPEERVINISSAISENFHPIMLSLDVKQKLMKRYGLKRPFILYTGGIDFRKNIDGLIQAFALLPSEMLERFQLAIVCSITEHDKEKYSRLVSRLGLRHDQVVFTGFVPEDDLIAFYNTCELFVFPSLHEGFGLPVLEAMACGAPAIGSNCTSIPEVIGRADALFDPNKPQDIAEKIYQVLTDDHFCRDLRTHGLGQAKKFSWDHSAKRALEGFEELHIKRESRPQSIIVRSAIRPRLAYISPLPPMQSGIADYSAELLPELARYYEIDVIVDQPEINDPWIAANLPIRSVEWFSAHADSFDRILYHFGNSHFHRHMFGLLKQHSGTVVLHDFFMGNILDWMECHGLSQDFLHALYESHGYGALIEEKMNGREAIVWRYPCNLDVLYRSTGTIVHSSFAIKQATKWYGEGAAKNIQRIPFLRAAHSLERQAARSRLNLSENAFLVCSFGLLGPIKLNDRLLTAWLSSKLALDMKCHLVFVGENHGGDYGTVLIQHIKKSSLEQRIRITGFVSQETYLDYIAAADMAVQLRCNSRGETSAAIFDCLAHGVPLVINAHGAAAELPDNVLIKLEDEFTDQDLVLAMEKLHQDEAIRQSLSHNAISYVKAEHTPAKVGNLYFEAIENFFTHHANSRRQRLIRSLARIPGLNPSDKDLIATSDCIHVNDPNIFQKQLLIDISMLAQHDARTGIQRVVRAVLQHLLFHPLVNYRIEPIYERNGTYFYARQFTLEYIGRVDLNLEDAPVEVRMGDVFLGIDLFPQGVPDNDGLYRSWRNRGVEIYFVVYDLLAVLQPDLFLDEVYNNFNRWLMTVARVSKGLICISRSVGDELIGWLNFHQPQRYLPLNIGYFHLGADFAANSYMLGMPESASKVLERLHSSSTVLMVGTVEPRKAHEQVLAAFESMWTQDIEINLVIVGKQGWMVDALAAKLRQHIEFGKRLFWLEGISDEYLEQIYAASTVLLAASKGEGFGLPLIEAAQHKLPIIARDIPVFREVAGEHAFYFSGEAPESLANAIKDWLDLYARGEAPSSSDMPWLTWAESTQQLINVILGGNWYKKWPHDAAANNLKASVCAASGDTSVNAT